MSDSIIRVDYGRSLEQMITAGHYHWSNDEIILQRFPLEGEGIEQCEVKVFHFNRTMFSEAVVEAIKAAGWEPGKIGHLLAFGEKYPDEQRKFPIIALGSVTEILGLRYVPCLSVDGRGHLLFLHFWDYEWHSYYRFIAVRRLYSVPAT